MAEPDRQQVGDGGDNYAHAAQKTAEAVKKISQSAAKKAAATAGAKATANASAAIVQMGVQSGKAVAQVAAGTAAGGPWGAILAALWAMKNTLFKVLICICLFLLFFIVLIVSLPSIIGNSLFHTAPASVDPSGPTELFAIYEDMSMAVSGCVTAGYEHARAEVERIISDGGYDYDLSTEATIDYGHTSVDYDICYILAAYSASMNQKGTTKQDLQNKLNAVASQMLTVTYEVMQTEVTVPAESEDGAEEVDPVDGDEEDTEEKEPETKIVKYVQCTIHPFNASVILTAFGIDQEAPYDQFGARTGDVIETMAMALRATLYGVTASGQVPPINDAELAAFLESLTCSPARKELMRVGLSLVGRVHYFWGGKSGPGWNNEWNTPRLVTVAGSSSTGTIRPYGLDCSGFTSWAYKTALGFDLVDGSANQWSKSTEVTEADLLPGDLGFMDKPGSVDINHVLLYAGRDTSGNKLWLHCASGAGGVVLNSPNYVKYYRRVNGIDLETAIPLNTNISREVVQTLRVNVTHYCPCAVCNGQWTGGPSASGKTLQLGMVAMSSYWPFGTMIEINGVVYTVEDRGDTGIENDITRVDIFVLDHQEALRRGRFWTDAKIYRIGR